MKNGSLKTVDLGGAATGKDGTYTITFTAQNDQDEEDKDVITSTLIIKPVPKPVITADDEASTKSGTPLDDPAIITLFNVSVSDGKTPIVDQSAVDYDTPGDYTISFTSPEAEQKDSTLKVEA